MTGISLRAGALSLALLLGLSLATADMSFARGEKDGGRPEIQLTPEQREKADMILSQNREAAAQARQELKAKRERLRELMNNPQANRAQAESLCSEIGVLEGKRLLNRFDLNQQLMKEGIPPQVMKQKDGKGGKRGFKRGKEKRD